MEPWKVPSLGNLLQNRFVGRYAFLPLVGSWPRPGPHRVFVVIVAVVSEWISSHPNVTTSLVRKRMDPSCGSPLLRRPSGRGLSVFNGVAGVAGRSSTVLNLQHLSLELQLGRSLLTQPFTSFLLLFDSLHACVLSKHFLLHI